MLQAGDSVRRVGKSNPAYLEATKNTFYGHKKSDSGLFNPPKLEQIRIKKPRHSLMNGRNTSLKMGETDLNFEMS